MTKFMPIILQYFLHIIQIFISLYLTNWFYPTLEHIEYRSSPILTKLMRYRMHYQLLFIN